MEKKEKFDWHSVLNWEQRNKHPYITYNIIRELPKSLGECLKKEKDNIRDIAKEFVKRDIGIVYFVGSGNSFYSAFPSKYAVEKIAGIPSIAEDSFELAHYTLPHLSRSGHNLSHSAVVGFSDSGRTKACVDALKIASEKGAYAIGVTGNPEAPMKKIADGIILVRGELREDIPVRVRTYPMMSFMAYLLATALREELKGQDETLTKLQDQLNGMPETVEKVIKETEEPAIKLAGKHVTDEDIYFVGGGPNYGTALDGALMANEMSRARPWAWETEEMCHGPWSTLRRKSIVFMISPLGESYERNTMAARGIRNATGATVISVVRKGGDTSELAENSDQIIEVPEALDEVFTPIPYDIPLLLFDYYRGVSGHVNPDAHGMDRHGFHKIARYFHPPGWH